MRHVLLGLVFLLTLGFAACGDAPVPSEEGTTPEGTTTGDATPPAPAPAPEPAATQTPEALGEAVAALYVDTMRNVVSALESRPEVDVAKAELERIKGQAVEQLVPLGRKRAALDDAGRAVVDRRVRAGLRGVPSDVFQAFSETQKHYADADREAGDLLAAFNVITQYAAFELLKKQAPEEFERLGLGE